MRARVDAPDDDGRRDDASSVVRSCVRVLNDDSLNIHRHAHIGVSTDDTDD